MIRFIASFGLRRRDDAPGGCGARRISAPAPSSQLIFFMNVWKWTGIATAAGLIVGLAGRILRIRAKHARPELVIIDAK